MKKLLAYIFLLIHSALALEGQNGIVGSPDWQIKPSINHGFILIHRTSIGHLVEGYPNIYELNISKPTLGNKLWHLENNKPDVGITLQCIDFANPSQLGYAFTIAPYVEIPLNAKEKKSRVIFRLCWGATYINKKFDIERNHKNIAIGSHFNAYVQFRWFWHLPISKNLRLEPGVAFTHASNARAKNPNLGLNVVSVNLGLNWLIASPKKPQTFQIDSSTKVKTKNEVLLFAAYGFNQREIISDQLNTFVISAAYQRNIRNTHKFSAGVDAFYDQNYLIDYEDEYLKKPTDIDKLRLAARFGYSYNVGRISFPVEMGYYFLQKSKPDGYVVSRIGLRYYTKCGLVGHFGLRTHFAVAYNFEYGLGYRFYL